MPRAVSLIETLERRTLLTVSSGFNEVVVGQGLREPTAMVISPDPIDPAILIAEKDGRLRRYQSQVLEKTILAYLDVESSGEFGFLGLAIDRNFERNRYVYINYTVNKPTIHQRISRFFLAGNELLLKSETILLELPDWEGATKNIGGGLGFMYDGTLLIGIGDGGKKERAGDTGSPFGKILRIRPDGTVPANNPWSGGEGWQKYVWAYGLRDPAKFAVNTLNGIVYINDPGEKKYEEINIGEPGGNYGWHLNEGPDTPQLGDKPIAPVYSYAHAPADPEAIPGGHIAGGTIFNPGTLTFPLPFAGDYIFADRDSNIVQVADIELLRMTGEVSPFATDIPRPVDVEFNAAGNLFVLAQGDGPEAGQLIRYQATGAPSIGRSPKSATVAPGETKKLSVFAGGIAPLSYQWQVNGVDIPGATGTTITVGPFTKADSGVSYTVRVSNELGVAISKAAVITVRAASPGDGGNGTPDPGTVPPPVPGGTDGNPTSPPPPVSTPGKPVINPFKPPSKEPIPMGPIDLLPTVGATPTAIIGGTVSKVPVKVYNLGLDTARGALAVRLRVTNDSGANVVAGEGNANIRIKPGNARTVQLRVTWPQDLHGDYTITVDIDPASVLTETNEANNSASAATTVQISPPFVDVRTQAGASPANLSPGGKASIAMTVYNDGNTAANGEANLLVWAIPDGANPSEAAAVGIALYAEPRKVKLPAGKGKSIKLKLLIPDSLPAGLYRLVVTAEAGTGLIDADPSNNLSSSVAASTVA